MEVIGLHHEPKSRFAYAVDDKTLSITLRTTQEKVSKVEMIWGDPFDWAHSETTGAWHWRSGHSHLSALERTFEDDLYEYWTIRIQPEWKRVRYAFLLESRWLYTARGLYDLEQLPDKRYALSDYFNFPYINQEDIHRGPDWVQDTVWYQIFPERFCNGDPSIDLDGTLPWNAHQVVTNKMRFGGDLEGVRSKLAYLKDLGITGIYFTPIFEASSTHKYDTIDYFKIDPAFGTNETFRSLVQEAHQLGIKIMLDGVFNHCGYWHPFFQDVVLKGRQSQYWDWFHMLDSDEGFSYETFAFTKSMPKWRTGNKACEAYLLSVGEYWIEHFDIDGWRLDVSNEVSHDFWRKFRQRIKALKPACFLLGENWDDAGPWLQGDQFDGVMNYEWTTPIWRLLADEKHEVVPLDSEGFRHQMSRLLALTPEPIFKQMFNLLDSHDTSRLMTLLGNDLSKVKLAYWIQMTFGGSPSIYYGSEFALKGEGDGNRVCVPWDTAKTDACLFDYLKDLIAIRHSEPLMRSVKVRFLKGDSRLVVYEKYGEARDQVFLRCLFNISDQVVAVSPELWPEDAHWVDAHLFDGLSHQLEPYCAALLKCNLV